MKRRLLVAAVLMTCSTLALAEDPQAASVRASGVDRSGFDANVRPQDDLFRAVNGGWIARAEIPSDRSNYGAFAALAEKAEKDLKEILESAAAEKAAPGTEAQKLGDLYASFLDEKSADELGVAPIASELTAVDRIESKADLARTFAALRRVGVSGAFRVMVAIDAKKPDSYVVTLAQDGLGLPDRDYYLKPKYREKLAAYSPHVARVLELAGTTDAAAAASTIVAFETEIAQAHWPKEESRDDSKTHNKMSRAELEKLAPGFDWQLFLDEVGAGGEKDVVVEQLSYFTAFGKMVGSVPLSTWKAWLRWRVVHHFAHALGHDLIDAEFDFYERRLRGTPEQRARWKRAVGVVQGSLGEALGKLYVAKRYPPEAQARMEALVANLIAAYRERFQALDWMSAATKEKALAKLAAFTPKIGHPKKWRDYSSLEIKPHDLVGNVRRASAFDWNRNLGKLGKPVDRDEWHMTPQTVNAYYDSSRNEIVFPAAILQPPFFSVAADDAVNYGGIGAVIGHEIGHGFDDQGSKWDGAGNLSDWWTPADRAEFDRRSAALAAQYDRFEPFPGFKVNGKLTLGENMGDLGGATVAHAAYRRSLGGKAAPVIDGLTGDQRFFMGFAQIWRTKAREEEMKVRLATDPHSPPEFRTNGTVRNVAAFYEAFGVKEGDKLFLPPEERVKIW
jgi:putative endopeptidase